MTLLEANEIVNEFKKHYTCDIDVIAAVLLWGFQSLINTMENGK